MRRKQFKRNVQKARQRRSVTYMRDRKFIFVETMKNAGAGLFVGCFIVIVFYKGLGVW